MVLPRAGNLGGGGFMLVYSEELKKTIAMITERWLHFRLQETCFLIRREITTKKSSIFFASAGVPGTVAGLYYALNKYGTLSWGEILDPAIKLAEDGFVVPHDLSSVLRNYKKRLTANEATAKAYYKANKETYSAGEVIKLPDLAWSLKELKKVGPDAFYKGKIAKKDSPLKGNLRGV
ncbi:MAG: hypothetical protein Ct9H300mP3_09300 [Gammaproteobacteria bacterium]|nr:MAG: hypothetical protein Ct9H300mP3_09300 [Gammaproteobacteria bacterium]